jgi:hypothetical protein
MLLAQVGVKCPDCGLSFNTRQVPVFLDIGRRNSELRKLFDVPEIQFEPYEVCTCPSCGKADWMKLFPPTGTIGALNQPNTTPHLQYRNAALAAERSGREMFEIAFFYLYAAWCADDTGAWPQAREYRKLAASAFGKSLIDGTCQHSRRAETEYLIGELLRRAGEFEYCREHLRQVIPQLPGKFALMGRKVMRFAEQGNVEAFLFETDTGP